MVTDHYIHLGTPATASEFMLWYIISILLTLLLSSPPSVPYPKSTSPFFHLSDLEPLYELTAFNSISPGHGTIQISHRPPPALTRLYFPLHQF